MAEETCKIHVGVTRRAVRRYRVATCLLIAGLLTACSDGEEVRITTCSSVAAGMNVGADAIDVLSTSVESETGLTRITFQVDRSGLLGRVQWIECQFDELKFPQLVPELIAVDTSDGPLGDGRLFILKRWWLNDDPDSWQRDES